MISIEKIEDSFELPIGTRFYFMGHIYEIVKSDEGRWGCPKCALFDEHMDLNKDDEDSND